MGLKTPADTVATTPVVVITSALVLGMPAAASTVCAAVTSLRTASGTRFRPSIAFVEFLTVIVTLFDNVRDWGGRDVPPRVFDSVRITVVSVNGVVVDNDRWMGLMETVASTE